MNETQLNPKILIVDDKPQNLFALKKLLLKVEADVFEATSGVEALELTLKHDFCLAIVDIQMPEIDGYELVELLRGNSSTASLPVIFVSAIYSDEYHHRKGYEAGAVDFLSKPFVPEILLSKVRVFLDLYHQRNKLAELVEQLNSKNEALIQTTDRLQDANLSLYKRALQLETSNQVGQQITSILELEALLTAVVESIQTKFGYYFVGVWLFNEAKDKVILQAGLGRESKQYLEPGSTIELTTSATVMAWVAQNKQVYRVENGSTDPKFMILEALPDTHSEINLPLIVGQEMLGVLDIQSDQVAGFDDEDQQLLQTLANQIAIAIRNARLYKLEKKLNKDKDKFFSIISHDLRGPFGSLLGNAQLMKELIDELSKQELKEMSQSMYNQAQAAYNLLSNLLTWSQLQQGRIKYNPVSINLHQLAEDTICLLNEIAHNKKVQLSQTIEPGLCAYADSSMVDIVIRNLTSNAIKFTPTGGLVTLSASHQNDLSSEQDETEWIEVAVCDTGVGINQKNIDKLFKIDIHHTTTGTNLEKGTGLGLILCQEMVGKNGGRIWIESEKDKGTMVRFTIPANAHLKNK